MIAPPRLDLAAQRYIEAARLTNPKVRLVGVSLNTSELNETDRRRALDSAEQLLGVPAFDPLKTPLAPVLAKILD